METTLRRNLPLLQLCTSAFDCSVDYLCHFENLLVLEVRQVTDFAY